MRRLTTAACSALALCASCNHSAIQAPPDWEPLPPELVEDCPLPDVDPDAAQAVYDHRAAVIACNERRRAVVRIHRSALGL